MIFSQFLLFFYCFCFFCLSTPLSNITIFITYIQRNGLQVSILHENTRKIIYNVKDPIMINSYKHITI
jgi:hypothetical protein